LAWLHTEIVYLPKDGHPSTNHLHHHQQLFYGRFIQNYPGEPVPADTLSYDPQHPLCSIHVLEGLFALHLSKHSLVDLWVWNTPCMSSAKCYHLFATHAHTIGHQRSYKLIVNNHLYDLLLVCNSQHSPVWYLGVLERDFSDEWNALLSRPAQQRVVVRQTAAGVRLCTRVTLDTAITYSTQPRGSRAPG